MGHRQPSDYRFESEIQADILLEFGALKWIRIWRNNVGLAYPVSTVKRLIESVSTLRIPVIKAALAEFKRQRPVRYSVTGSADILGWLTGSARMVAIEVKMPGRHLDEDQVNWRDMFVARGGLYIVAYCVADVYAALEREGVTW